MRSNYFAAIDDTNDKIYNVPGYSSQPSLITQTLSTGAFIAAYGGVFSNPMPVAVGFDMNSDYSKGFI